MLEVRVVCPTHPTYRAIREPNPTGKTLCDDCRSLYDYALAGYTPCNDPECEGPHRLPKKRHDA